MGNRAGGVKWQIQYGLSGFTLGTGTTISNITTTSYTLTGLEIGSTYDWYIRTDCSNGNYSSWVGKITFTVTCMEPGASELPYFQGWEDNSGELRSDGTIMCTFDQIWSYDTDSPNFGRVRWGSNCPNNFKISGSGSLIFDRSPNGDVAVNHAILDLDLSNYSFSNDLVFSFSFRDINDENHPNDKVWVRGSINDSWIVAYDILPANKVDGQVYNIVIDLDSLLNENGQNPGQPFK